MEPNEFEDESGQAGHGDAQADILGGFAIIMMVLFLGFAVHLMIKQAQLNDVRQILKTSTGKVITEADLNKLLVHDALREKNADLERRLRESAHDIRELKILLAAEQEKLNVKDKDKKYVSTGLRIWILSPGKVIITDTEPIGDEWMQRYTCTETNKLLKSEHGQTQANFMIVQ